MLYELIISPKAKRHIKEWEYSGNKAVIRKLHQFLLELKEHPTTGSGQVERLQGNENRWSRRLNKKDRLVYEVIDNKVIVEVLTAKGHYEDK
jgi:toxin YoeB